MNYETQKLYDRLKNNHYAWVGQNASTGTAHPITGMMSMYGRYIAFPDRKTRDNFVDNFYNNNPSEYATKCSVNTGRRYSLGCSWYDYLMDLAYCDQHDINQ